MPTLEELQEHPPKECEAVAELLQWSVNYDHPTPAALFLDVIGYSDYHLGAPMFDLAKVPERIGHMEAAMLSRALVEYGDRPGHVQEYVEAYLHAEQGADEEQEASA